LDTDFVDDVVERLDEGARVSAEILKFVLGTAMKIFDVIPATLEASSLEFGGPRKTFTASFYVAESGIAVSTSGADSVTLLIEDSTSKEYVYYQRENPDDYPPASELQGFIEDNPDMGLGIILGEVFGYQLDGRGIVYVLSDFQEQAQDALNNSFDFGSGDDGIVDGTDSADVIDHSYTDTDGTSISDGDDIIQAGLGDDVVYGGGGNDRIEGGGDNDTIYAGFGDDTIVYTSGDDVITGHGTINYGNDTLDLSKYTADQVSFRIVGHDVFIDTPDGTIELDYQVRYDVGHSRSNIENIIFSDGTLDEAGIADRAIADQATTGDDVITGSFQSEIIAGGTGNDTLSGINGSDTFVFAVGDGVDHITDYNAANDTLEFTGISFADLTITQVGSDVLIEYGTSDQLIVENSVIANFNEPEFLFA